MGCDSRVEGEEEGRLLKVRKERGVWEGGGGGEGLVVPALNYLHDARSCSLNE
jgi:hypothetical protein